MVYDIFNKLKVSVDLPIKVLGSTGSTYPQEESIVQITRVCDGLEISFRAKRFQ